MATVKLAIDFDSVKTNVYKLGSGLVLSEATVATVSQDDKHEIKLIGDDAKKLIGKTAKNTKIVFPLFDGEIVNEKVASGLLSGFFKKIEIKNGLTNCQALFSVPCGVTADMIEKYKKVAKNCGISKTYFVETPLLSALGQRIPLNNSTPSFIIDMGGGVTNIAAVSLDGVIAGVSVNFGANKISTDIIDFLANKYNLQIGLLTAEKIKKDICSLDKFDALSMVVNGRDTVSGAPKALSIKAKEIFDATRIYFDKISEIALIVLKKLPPEVSAEIRHAGIYLSGLGSSIYGLDKYYKDIFDMQVNVATNGDMVVALGGGIAIGDSELLNKLSLPT